MVMIFPVIMFYMCFKNSFEKNRPPIQKAPFYEGLKIYDVKIARLEKCVLLARNQL